MDITITGSASRDVAPELARVHLQVAAEGPDRAAVVREVNEQGRALVAELEGLPHTELEEFHVGTLRAWSYRNEERTVHEASLAVTAEFADFAALARQNSAWAERGIRVEHTSWALRDDTRDATMAGLVGDALDDARASAERIAQHLGAGDLEVVHVTDQAGAPSGRVANRMFAAQSFDGAPVEPKPEDVSLSVEMTVVFRTR